MGRAFQAQRLELVANAMAQMLSHERICELYAREWNCKRETIKRYIREVERMWREKAAVPQPVDERRAYLTEVALVILRKQIGKGHEASAQRTLDMIAKWHGIGQQQVTTAIGIFNDRGAYTNQEAIREHVRQIEAEQAERVRQLAAEIAQKYLAEQNADDNSTAEPPRSSPFSCVNA